MATSFPVENRWFGDADSGACISTTRLSPTDSFLSVVSLQRRRAAKRTEAVLGRRERFREYIDASTSPARSDDDILFFEPGADGSGLDIVPPTAFLMQPTESLWMQWLQHESPRDFFVRLEEATPTSHEPASLQVSMLAQALRSRGFYTILFYDDSGIGLHVAAVWTENSLDLCEISELVIETFDGFYGSRGIVLAHVEIKSAFDVSSPAESHATGIISDFLFTTYGE